MYLRAERLAAHLADKGAQPVALVEGAVLLEGVLPLEAVSAVVAEVGAEEGVDARHVTRVPTGHAKVNQLDSGATWGRK